MPLPPPARSDDQTRLARGHARQGVRLAAALLAGQFASVVGSPALAELYRWVDGTGATVYSQDRPPEGFPATVIAPPKSHPVNGAASGRQPPQADKERRREAIEREFDEREEKKQLAAEAARKEADEAAKQATEKVNRQRICDTARRNLETLVNHGGGRLGLPDGTARFLSRDELATMTDQARDQIRDNCD